MLLAIADGVHVFQGPSRSYSERKGIQIGELAIPKGFCRTMAHLTKVGYQIIQRIILTQNFL